MSSTTAPSVENGGVAMPVYLAVLLLCAGIAISVSSFEVGNKKLSLRVNRILGGCGLLLAMLMSVYLILVMLLLGRD